MNTDTMATFATSTEDALVALNDRYASGELGYEEFLSLAVIVLVRAWARGVALGDVGVAADLSAADGQAVPATGVGIPDGTAAAVTSALVAVLASEQYKTNAASAIAVLGRSQALEAVQHGTSEALASHDVGWTRVLNAGACELCQDLAGDVLPAHAKPYHHKGCGCSQRPIKEQS